MYQVAKKLQGAEKILLCMGYERVTSSSTIEVQELKYSGEVNTEKVVRTASDLVVLHSEFDRISDLVKGAIQENYRNVILRDILEARSDLDDTLDITLRKSLSCSFQRLRQEKQPQFVQQSQYQSQYGQQPVVMQHLSQAPPLLQSRGLQQQIGAELLLTVPSAQGGHGGSLQRPQDYYNSEAFRQSSAPNIQGNVPESRVRQQQPPSPLLQQDRDQQQLHDIIATCLNSKDQYSKVDKSMIDKLHARGVSSAGPNCSDNVATSPAQQSGAISFDPLKLPEPAYDTHDLEMFHQEARTPEDSFTSGHMSMLIDPRSMDYDYSGPNLDDHLTYRSGDSGHMGLSGSRDGGSIRGGILKEDDEVDDQPRKNLGQEEEETCTAGSDTFGLVKAPRIQDITYEEVTVGKDEEPLSPTASFAPHPLPPALHTSLPRSFSEEQRPSSLSERAPLPRPRSNQNLSATTQPPQIQTPPPSPGRQKPIAKPRKIKSTSNIPKPGQELPSVTPSHATTSEENIMNAEITTFTSGLSEKLQEKLLTIDEGAVTSHVSSMDSASSMPLSEIELDNNTPHSEAHTSLESDSPHPSVEAHQCMSNKSDPCPSTSPNNASPACSGVKEFIESSVTTSLGGSWVSIEVKNKEVELEEESNTHSSTCISLDSHPRQRERAHAFSTKLDKSDKSTPGDSATTATKKKISKSLETLLNDESGTFNTSQLLSAEIRNAKPCWYCTNLTTNKKCEVCGHEQKEDTSYI